MDKAVKLMLSAFITLLLATLPGAAAEQRCALKPAASVPLAIGESQVPTIPVLINGRAERLFIDTGAPVSLISAGYVVELGLPRQPYPRGVLVLANGTSPQEFAMIETLSVGDLTGHNVKFFIVPSIEMRSTLAGTFGVDFLQGFDVDFDFAGKKFDLISPDDCHGNPVYWTKGNYFRVPLRPGNDKYLRVDVMLDGQPLKADIDSGSSTSAMNLELAKKLFGLHEETLPRSAFNNEAGEQQLALLTGKIYEHTFKSLDVGGFHIASPTLVLASNLKFGDADLVIGMSEINRLHLYISYRDRVVYITPANAH